MIRIDDSTAARLETRRKDDESVDALIQRLLDETAEEVALESLLNHILDHYDHVAGIRVDHPTSEDPSYIHIKVFTGDVREHRDEWEFIRTSAQFDAATTHVVIEDEEGDVSHTLPFQVFADPDGPTGETIGMTPVYVADDVVGSEPLSLEAGLARLRAKIGKSADEIRAEMEDRGRGGQSATE